MPNTNWAVTDMSTLATALQKVAHTRNLGADGRSLIPWLSAKQAAVCHVADIEDKFAQNGKSSSIHPKTVSVY